MIESRKEPTESKYSPKEKILFTVILILATWIFSLSSVLVNDEKVAQKNLALGFISSILAIGIILENDQKNYKEKRNQRKLELEKQQKRLKIEQMFSEMPVPSSLQKEQEIENFRQKLIELEKNEKEVLFNCQFLEESIFAALNELFILQLDLKHKINSSDKSNKEIYKINSGLIYQKFADFSERNWELGLWKIHSYFFARNWEIFLQETFGQNEELYNYFIKTVNEKLKNSKE